MQKVSVDLWFDTQAQEAVEFYTSIFPNSKMNNTIFYGPDVPERDGQVLYIDFELAGQRFGAVNGGPQFKFNPAISLVVACKNQEELDEYWDKLSAVPEAEQCGWLEDKYGLSWQIIPDTLQDLLDGGDNDRVQRVMREVMQMKKLDIARMEKAAAG